MKKNFAVLMSFCFVCTLCSCGEIKDTGTPPDKDMSVESLVGSTEEIPYESFLDDEMFELSYENYTDYENPLQLSGGTYEDAFVAKPFKSVLVNDTEVVAPLNVWQFPVVHEDEYIGFINCDMRFGEPQFFGGEGMAPALNEALKRGCIAVFDTSNGTYGIYEDNTVVNITEEKIPYDGTLTFEQINQEYNLITPDSVSDVIYTSDNLQRQNNN